MAVGAALPKYYSDKQGVDRRTEGLVHGVRGAGGTFIRQTFDLYKPGDDGLFKGVGSKTQVVINLLSTIQH